MRNLMRETWQGAVDTVTTLATGALDILITLHASINALPLPFAVMAFAAGVALFHAIDQRAQRRDQ
jgi:hypothetical protein